MATKRKSRATIKNGMTGRERSIAALKKHQFKPGIVNNPHGKNQFTYRQDAEATFDALLKSVSRKRDAHNKKQTIAQEIISTVMAMAREKDRWALQQVMERILPKTALNEHAHRFPDGPPERAPVLTPNDHAAILTGILEERKGETLQ